MYGFTPTSTVRYKRGMGKTFPGSWIAYDSRPAARRRIGSGIKFLRHQSSAMHAIRSLARMNKRLPTIAG